MQNDAGQVTPTPIPMVLALSVQNHLWNYMISGFIARDGNQHSGPFKV